MSTLRVYNVGLAGTAAGPVKLRVYKVSATGTVTVALNPFGAYPILEPGFPYTITAVLGPGSAAPDFTTWRVVSGTPVALTNAGLLSRTLVAPSGMPPAGASVTLGVTATLGSITTPERQVTLSVYPQTDWSRRYGQPWVGSRADRL